MTPSIDNRGTEGLAQYRATTGAAATTSAATIAMFVGGAVLARAVYAVVGADGIAAVPSPRASDRATYLFWSHPAEAERWADVLVAAPRIVSIDLNGFLSSTVPAMIEARASAGLDWSADPVEAEIEPAVLAAHLREDLVRDFASTVTRTRFVWVLEGDHGIAGVTGLDGGAVTPLWPDRHMAEVVAATIAAPGLQVTRKPLLDLTNRYLLSTEGLKARLAPAYLHATTPVLMSPWALKALLNGSDRPKTRLAAIGG